MKFKALLLAGLLAGASSTQLHAVKIGETAETLTDFCDVVTNASKGGLVLAGVIFAVIGVVEGIQKSNKGKAWRREQYIIMGCSALCLITAACKS
jgi:hypothetical protein